MTATDMILAIIIALYAMFGGALISASITSPENCRRVLKLFTPNFHERVAQISVAVIILGFVLIALTGTQYPNGLFYNPALWFAGIHLAFFGLLVACSRITAHLLKEEER